MPDGKEDDLRQLGASDEDVLARLFSRAAIDHSDGFTGNTMADLPIMCTLTPDSLRTRREGLLSELLRHAIGREELPEGLRLRFAPSGETLATIARAVDAERHCCRFLRFAIVIEPDGGPISLELHGPAGTREFVAALLEA